MAYPTGEDVAAFLGVIDDPELVAQAARHVEAITAMALAYTRKATAWAYLVPPDVAAVITTASARLLANPEQVDTVVGGASMRGGFTGWSLAETLVLNAYRRRSA